MKSLIIATAAITLAASSAFAQATIDSKPTTSNGSTVGRSSSSYTGNGDYIGGNGTSGVDQTTGPASRPFSTVNSLLLQELWGHARSILIARRVSLCENSASLRCEQKNYRLERVVAEFQVL